MTLAATWAPTLDTRRLADRLGLAACLAVGLVFGSAFAFSTNLPVDADMYFRVGHQATYYGAVWGPDARYVYPPVLAQLVGLVPVWQPFVASWIALMFVGLWAATREWALPVLLVSGASAAVWGLDSPLANPVMMCLIGNIQAWLAAAIVIGFRYPGAWALPILTKIGPGVGLAWFAFRREWRPLAVALGSTAAVALVSFVLAPAEWWAFLGFARANAGTPSPEPVVAIAFPVRVAMSLGLLYWGARTDRPWVVPIAAGWAAIALYQWSWVTMAVAALPLARRT